MPRAVSRTSGAGQPAGSRTPAHRRPLWRLKTEHVDRERVLRGYTQAALAKRARVDPGTLSDLLCGKRRPTLGTISALCQALGVQLADVIAFED